MSNELRTSGPNGDLTQHHQRPNFVPQTGNGPSVNFRPDQMQYQSQEMPQRGSNPVQVVASTSGPNELANGISNINISQQPARAKPLNQRAHSQMASANGYLSSDDDGLEDNSEPREPWTTKWSSVISMFEGIEARKKLGEGGYGKVVEVTDVDRRLVINPN